MSDLKKNPTLIFCQKKFYIIEYFAKINFETT